MQDLTRGSLTQARRPCHASSPPDARAAGHRRAKVTTMTDNPGVIAPPPLLYAGALAAGAVLEQIVPLPMLPPGAGLVPGVALIVLGLGLAGWCDRKSTRLTSSHSCAPRMPSSA